VEENCFLIKFGYCYNFLYVPSDHIKQFPLYNNIYSDYGSFQSAASLGSGCVGCYQVKGEKTRCVTGEKQNEFSNDFTPKVTYFKMNLALLYALMLQRVNTFFIFLYLLLFVYFYNCKSCIFYP
jgi:hypothetical protein